MVTTEVPFTKESGVCKVKCDINGLPLHFVFDTGASDVTISMVEATFMMKNGYLNANDVVDSLRYNNKLYHAKNTPIWDIKETQTIDFQ